jgi:hypothetical protein
LEADVALGVTDNAPRLRATLYQPNKPDGTRGDPWPMFGGSCTVIIAPKDRSASAFVGTCSIVDDGTDNAGVVEFDWTGFDTATAKDYDFRFKGVTGAGDRFSVPNAGWYSLAVTADPG